MNDIIRTERKGNTLVITLNRPDKLNALSLETFQQFELLLQDLEAQYRTGVRAVLLTGSGEKAFAAGADISQMSKMNPNEGHDFAALAQRVTEMIEGAPVPFIACVNGFALGGGCELAMSCDFIYATTKAKFGQPEVNLGLIPGFGGCVRLRKLVGPARAKEMIYTGIAIEAHEALRIGLVSRIFSDNEEMMMAAFATAELIAQKSSVAITLCKRTLNRQQGLSTTEGLAIELEAFRDAFDHPQKHEGVAAFLEKRPPRFI